MAQLRTLNLMLVCLALARSACFADELRTWHLQTQKGKQVLEAQAATLSAGELVLVDKSGKEHRHLLETLSADERKQALFDVVGRGVVLVETKDAFDRPIGGGSGFLVARSGYLLTNYHVIRGAAAIQVKFRGIDESVAADCLAKDDTLDLAVLKIATVPETAHVLTLAREKPTTGSTAWTLGYPNGILTPDWGAANGVHATKELPASMRQWLKAADDTSWIQTNAVLNSGSSGSPLLNDEGQVLGINTFIAGPQQGFALSIAQAADLYRSTKRASALTLPIPPGEDEPTLSWVSREAAPLLKKQLQDMQQFQIASAQLTPKQVAEQVAELQTRYRKSFLELAHHDPASWPGQQALLLACDMSLVESPEARDGLAIIGRLVEQHHLQSRKVAEFTQKLTGRTDSASLQLCKKVYETSPHKDVQAYAAQCLALGRMNWLLQHGGLNLVETKAARDEIDLLLTQLQGKYAKVSWGGQPVKDACLPLKEFLASIHVGLPARAIEGKTSSDGDMKLRDYAGKVVMLDFFADYCPPCRSMYPEEKKICEEMKVRPFVLLGVNGDDKKVLAELESSRKITWSSWADGSNGPIARQWRLSAVPTIFLIDHRGIVRRQFVGTPKPGQLQQDIDSLLAETKPQ